MGKNKNYVKRAMAAWGKIIHYQFGNCCAVCGKKYGRIEAHHIAGRKNYAVQFETKLGILLCEECHRTGKNAAHRNPETFLKWLKSNYPTKYSLYQKLRHKIVYWFEIDIKQICLDLEAQAKNMAGGYNHTHYAKTA